MQIAEHLVAEKSFENIPQEPGERRTENNRQKANEEIFLPYALVNKCQAGGQYNCDDGIRKDHQGGELEDQVETGPEKPKCHLEQPELVTLAARKPFEKVQWNTLYV